MNLEFNQMELRDLASYANMYEQLLLLLKERNELPYLLYEKKVKNISYLYQQKTKDSNATSIGKLNEDSNLKLLDNFQNYMQEFKTKKHDMEEALSKIIPYVKITKTNKVESKIGKLLRLLDLDNRLGKDLLVVGTNSFLAYELHANELMFDVSMTTLDFDLTCYNQPQPNKKPLSLLKLLKETDSSYHINIKKPYQAINSELFEVELLAAPSILQHKDSIAGGFRPIPLMEQEWLLLGKPIRQILISTDGLPAPIVAPDPRWMILHKFWLSQKPERNKLKFQKDFKQATRLLELVNKNMHHEYPFDNEFIQSIPKELIPIFEQNVKPMLIKIKLNLF